MNIQNAIKLIHSTPDSWIRVAQIQRLRDGLEISFSIHKGKRGKRVEEWIVSCRGVHETSITDFDGGGLGVYMSTHPAARQYVARHARLSWSRSSDESAVLAALHRAHMKAAGDWISFDRYLFIGVPRNDKDYLPLIAPVSGRNFVCKGPEFLLRAYAKSLESIGETPKLTIRDRPRSKLVKPKVLHFGTSFVVANAFEAGMVGETAT